MGHQVLTLTSHAVRETVHAKEAQAEIEMESSS